MRKLDKISVLAISMELSLTGILKVCIVRYEIEIGIGDKFAQM